MKDYLIKRPMLICAISCVIIAFSGHKVRLSLPFIAIALSLIFAYFLCIKKSNTYAVVTIILMAMLVSTFLTLKKTDKLFKLKNQKTNCKFTVCETTDKEDTFYTAIVKINESDVLPRGTKLSIYYYYDALSIGDIADGELKIEQISDEYKPNFISRGIYLKASCNKYTKTFKSNRILKAVGKLRHYIESTLFGNLEYSEASTLTALLLGNSDYFSPRFAQNVKSAGVSHVMVVSGMHLGIILTLFISLFEKIIYNKYLKSLLQIIITLAVALLCGFTMSILRAGLMFFISSLAPIVNRKSNPESSLSAAVVLILLFSPFAYLNAALHLSVLSTFGILSVAIPTVCYLRDRKIIENKIVFIFVSMVLVTTSATLMTLPETIRLFGYVSTVGIFTNLFITYAVTLCVWLGIIALIITPVAAFLAKPFFFVCSVLLKYINYVINSLGELPFSTVELSGYFSLAAVAVIIIIFEFMLTCKTKIDMLKLKEMNEKILKEGGKSINGGNF